jgi:signal transduction histidine kinase/pSer/pThr/pTyr-binding forkhead associated (FHA) protein
VAALVDINGPQPRRFKLGPRTTLGRDPGNTIAFPDPLVSCTHAEIRRTPEGQYQLVNLSSTNGTYVRGTRVSAIVLVDGDEILMGSTSLRFDGRDNPVSTKEMAAPILFDQSPESRPTLKAVAREDVQLVAKEPFVPIRERGVVTSFRPQGELSDEAIRRDYEKLRAAYELSRALGGEEDLDAILERICETAIDLLRADRVAIMLIDPTSGKPVPRVAKQRDHSSEKIALSSTIINQVVSNQTAVLCDDIEQDNRFNRQQSVVLQGIRSAMCVPMLHEGELLGITHLDSKMATKVFDEQDLEVLSSIACQAAFAVKTALLKDHIRELERQRAAAIRELVSGASHFINNPLAVIRANVSLLTSWASELTGFHAAVRKSPSAPPELPQLMHEHNIEFIDGELSPMSFESLKASHRIGEVVEAMRLFDHRADDETEPVNLIELVDEVLESHRAAIAAVAQVHRQLAPCPPVRGERRRLVQMFANLVANAHEAIEPGAPEQNWLVVSTQVVGTNAYVTIDDTGRGLPPGDEDKVFVPFYTSRLDGSLGLGLAVAAEVARQHQGSIQMGPRDGGGTRVTVQLPIGS